jgi:hypothetical protein
LIFFIFIISTTGGPVAPFHLSSFIFIAVAVVYCLFLFLMVIHHYKFYTYENYTCFFRICRVLLPSVLPAAHYKIPDIGLQTYLSFRLLLSFFTSPTILFTFAPALVLARSKEVTILPTIDEIPKITNPLDPDNIFGLQFKIEEEV